MNKDNSDGCMSIITRTPGKCLVTGGYLILNPNKSGLVINVDVYFKVTSTLSNTFIEVQQLTSSLPKVNINITSLFLNEQYAYSVLLSDSSIEITQSNPNSSSNKWIENSIKASFYSFICLNTIQNSNSNILSQLSNKTISIIINSDYRFYSYNINNNRKDIKTGLGSSSALIVSLCSNIITLLYKIANKSSINFQEKSINELDIHMQSVLTYACILSNNMSQNKIGSGFDIMACLFGNQIFHQCEFSFASFGLFVFKNEAIEDLKKYIEEYKKTYLSKLFLLGKMPSIKCALISIEYGSDTRIMVKNVLEWAESNKTNELFDDKLFKALDGINQRIIQLIANDILALSNCDQRVLLKEKSSVLKQLCIEYRTQLKEISKEAKVDIEPLILSPLLNDLIQSEHVIYAICPGAGGFDSILALGYEEEKDNECFIDDINNCINIFNATHKDNAYKAYIIKALIVNNGTVITL